MKSSSFSITIFKRVSTVLAIIVLVGTLLLGTIPPTHAETLTQTFSPAADSYVQADNPTTNYGTSTQIRADGSPLVKSYLRFNVENVTDAVTTATLRIYSNSNHSTGFTVYFVDDNTWTEIGITHNNAPAYSSTATGSSGQLVAGNWYNIPVTQLITGNGTYSIALLTTSSTAMSLASRESANSPQLIIESQSSGGSPTPTPTSTPSPTPAPSPSSTPTPPPTSDPVVVGVGDMVCGAGSTGAACKQIEVSDLILSINPIAFLALGDVQYESGEYNDFINFYEPSYGRIKNITKPAIGNHEYNDPAGSSDPSQVGYWDYFNGIGNYSGIGGDRDKGYYSFDTGNWHIIALNSNCSKVGGCSLGSPQNNWLRSDLAANLKPCTLAYFHHPLFSSGGRASSVVKPFWVAMDEYGGDVILTGHDHTYERFALMDANGSLNPDFGIREFVVGSGGRNHTHLVSAAANSQIFDDTSYGVLKMTLHDNSYDWQFVPIPGNTFTDSGSETCHGVPGGSATPTPSPSSTPSPGAGVLTFYPIADASVRLNNPSNNYGSTTTLEIDNNPQKKFFLRFNITGLTGSVVTAKLRLYNVNSSNLGGQFRKVLSSSWTEETVNWNNAPAFDSQILSSLGSVSVGNWYEADVTSAVVGNGQVDLGVTSTSSNGADYSSREGSFPPQLVVTQ